MPISQFPLVGQARRDAILETARQMNVAAMATEEVVAAFRAAVQDITPEEMSLGLRLAAEEHQRQAASLANLMQLCEPVFQDGRAKTIGEAIAILAAEGNPKAKAIQLQFAH